MQAPGSLSPTNFLCREMQTAKQQSPGCFGERAALLPGHEACGAGARNRQRAPRRGPSRFQADAGRGSLCYGGQVAAFFDPTQGDSTTWGGSYQLTGLGRLPSWPPSGPFPSLWLPLICSSLNSPFSCTPLVTALCPPLSFGIFPVRQPPSPASCVVFHQSDIWGPRRLPFPFCAGWLGLGG